MNKTTKHKTQRCMVFRLYTPKTIQTNKNIKNIINIIQEYNKKMNKNTTKQKYTPQTHNKHTTKNEKPHKTMENINKT